MRLESLDYSVTVEDIVAFNSFHADHLPDGSRKHRTSPLVLCFVAFLFQFPVIFVFQDPSQWMSLMLPIIGMGIFSYCFFGNQIRDSFVRYCLRRGGGKQYLGRHLLRFTPESLTDQSKFVTSTWHWDVIDRIEQTENHVFLYVTARSAVIVPKTAFDDSMTFQEFVDAIRTCHAASATGIMSEPGA